MKKIVAYLCPELKPSTSVWTVLALMGIPALVTCVQAEGSKEFTANGGNRAYLAYRNDSPAAQGGIRLRTYVKVYAKAGESINLGSSANGLGTAGISLTRPDGTVTNSPAIGAAFIGVITNRVQESNGPLPNSGGYNPWTVPVLAGQDGVWIVEFISPNAASTGLGTAIAANANWTRAANESATLGYVLAWDVTVRNSGGASIPGRAYLNKYSGNMGANNINFNAVTYVVTRDGFRYQANANGIDPFLFHFFVNNKGFRTNSATPLFQSVLLASANFQDPEAPDSVADTTAKMYFNSPATDLPLSASIAPAWGTNTWLNVAPTYPVITGFDYTGAEGTPHSFGSGIGGNITFNSSASGSYRIELDLDGNGSSLDPIDVILQGQMVAGSNTVTWNGKSGLGTPAPSSSSTNVLSIKITPLAGEVHFPYLDAENNPNGLILQRINGQNTPDYLVYWNDLAFAGGTAAIYGTNSAAGAHGWTSSFGDVRGLDTWAVAPGTTVVHPSGLNILTADLEALSQTLSSSNLIAGGTATYTLLLRNNGPDAATNATISDLFPAALTNITILSSSLTGVSSINSAGVSGNTFTASVNLFSNATVTFLLSVNVRPGTSGNLINVSRIIRGNDIADPDDPSGVGAGNNSNTNVVTVVPGADLATSKSGPANVLPGAPFNYTISVTNRGSAPAANVIVQDPLPPGVTFQSASGTYTFAAGVVTWAAFPLPNGAASNFTLTVTAPAGGNVTNVASTTSSTPDPDPSNNFSAPVFSSVTPSADLAISKSAAASVTAAQNFDYTITVTNLGPIAASSVTVTDALPVGLTFVSASAGGALNGAEVVWTNIGSLAAGSSTNLTLTVVAPANGASLTNTASVGSPTSDPNPTNNLTPPVFTTVTPSADLSVSKTGPASSPLPGANYSYTITVGNFGPSTAVSVTATDALPVNVTFVSASSGGALIGSNVVWADLGNLAAGSFTNLTLTVTAPLSGEVFNSASGGSSTSDPNPLNNVSPLIDTAVCNLSPVAVDDIASTPKNVSVSVPVLVNDSDPNNDVLTIVSVSPTNGVAIISGTNIVFTPATNFIGTATVVYTIIDGIGGTNSALISIIVFNTAPVANNQSLSTTEDTATNLVLTASDTDGDPLTFSIDSGPAHGTLSLLNTNTGAVTYTPATNYFGPDSFTFRVNDGTTSSPPATVNLIVTPLNDAPTAGSLTVTTSEDTSTNLTLIGSDIEGPVTFSILVGPTNGVISNFNPNTGTFTYTPNTNYFGPDFFTYLVNDGSLTATGSVFITVTPVNDAPIVVNDAYSLTKNTALTVPLPGVLANDTDVETNVLIALLVTGPTNGVLALSTNGSFIYTPNSNYVGPDVFTYRASDGSATSSVATVTLTVLPGNSAPVANNDSYTAIEDTVLTIPASGVLANDTDPDGNPLTAVLVTGPAHGTLTLNPNGSFTYTPATNYFGPDSFTYRANDGTTNSGLATVNLTVTGVNDAPIVVNDVTNVLEDASVVISPLVNDFDPEGAPLILTGVVTTNGTAVISGTNIVFTPATNFFGTVTLIYTVSDGTNTSTGTITVTVNPVNDAPVANNDAYTTGAETTLTIPVGGVLTNDTDIENNPLTAVLVSPPAHGTLVLDPNGSFTYTPAANYTGPDSFTYRANDGSSNSAPATVSIAITPLADLAVVMAGPTNVGPGATIVYTITLTNLGPSTATNNLVVDLMPTNAVFVSASGGGVLSNGIVRWPAIATLPRNGSTSFILTVLSPLTNATVVNIASATSGTPDPDPTNNNGSQATSVVVTTVTTPPFAIFQAAPVFNPQNGLFEETVRVTNTGVATVTGVRLLVGNINGTNGVPRTNVSLYNAQGTNVDGRPYVQYGSSLNPGQTVLFTLEFYVPDRRPFTNSLEALEILLPPAPTNSTAGSVVMDREFMDARFTPARFVIEFNSIPGRTYTIIYSDNAGATWHAATPTVTANANRVQWYDDGPPKTPTVPLSIPSRLYRVIVAP